MRWAVLVVGLILAGLGVSAIWVRLAPSDPEVWHVDPAKVAARGPLNSYLLAEGGDAPPLRLAQSPEAVASRLAAIARATPRTLRLAGQDGWTTYVTRSALWGFPDYTSVRVTPDGAGGAVVTVFARARFGSSDLGVNRARVEAWMAALSG